MDKLAIDPDCAFVLVRHHEVGVAVAVDVRHRHRERIGADRIGGLETERVTHGRYLQTIEQTSGRQRINIHGAVDLETGQTRMIEVETVDAASTIRLLESIDAFYPMLVLIHVFLDNARYHHAKIVREWLTQPGRRIKLHFIPPASEPDRAAMGRDTQACHAQ